MPGLVFSALSFMVAIPSAIKVFNWTATLYKGSISYDAPMLYALGFIGLFTMGGLTGLFLASLSTDVQLNGTYFIVAHFHYIMVGGAVMGYLGAMHYWWPKITGRLYPEGWARLAAAIIFVGFNLTFFPQFMLGYLGMPRRYAFYPAEFQFLNVMSSAGASILGVGYLIPLIYFVWSMRYGPAAGPNPWGATGLEWQTPSPPPTDNFERHSDRDRRAVRLREAGDAPCLKRTPQCPRSRTDGHPLAHQFEDLEQQHETDTLGIWVFLVTEIMFFGGLFAAYTIYRSFYPAAFEAGSRALNVRLGAINTMVLLSSSFTMAMAVRSAQTAQRKALMVFLVLTMLLGVLFLGIKGVEYHGEWVDRVVPSLNFAPQGELLQRFTAGASGALSCLCAFTFS